MTRRNAMEIMWKREEGIRTEQKTLRRVFIAEMTWTPLRNAFVGKNKTKWGMVKRSTHIGCRWQNIFTHLHEVIGQARKAITPLETRKCLVTDAILDNILQHTNQYILNIQPNFSRESDAKLRKN